MATAPAEAEKTVHRLRCPKCQKALKLSQADFSSHRHFKCPSCGNHLSKPKKAMLQPIMLQRRRRPSAFAPLVRTIAVLIIVTVLVIIGGIVMALRAQQHPAETDSSTSSQQSPSPPLIAPLVPPAAKIDRDADELDRLQDELFAAYQATLVPEGYDSSTRRRFQEAQERYKKIREQIATLKTQRISCCLFVAYSTVNIGGIVLHNTGSRGGTQLTVRRDSKLGQQLQQVAGKNIFSPPWETVLLVEGTVGEVCIDHERFTYSLTSPVFVKVVSRPQLES